MNIKLDSKEMIDEFLKRHGIPKKWICDKLHLSDNAFHIAYSYGFAPKFAQDIEQILHESAEELKVFELSKTQALKDLESLRERCGISLMHVANLLGYYSSTQIRWACSREEGLRAEEKKTIEKAIRQTAKELSKFKMPQEIIRKDAA